MEENREQRHLQVHENTIKDSDNVVANIIYDTYVQLFEDDGDIPSVRDVFNKIEYDFVASAYDIIYGLDADDIKEEDIMMLLTKKQCVFKWGGHICCPAQQVMFEEMYEDITGLLYDANKRQGTRS